MTEGSSEASALFAICYYGFAAAIAVVIFRRVVGEARPLPWYKLRWWVILIILASFAVLVAAVFLLDAWVQGLQQRGIS